MLAGMLLHVIEPAAPVDLSDDRRPGRNRTIDNVHNLAVVAIDYVAHDRVAQRAEVERLTAGRRIERGLIQHDVIPIVASIGTDDSAFETS